MQDFSRHQFDPIRDQNFKLYHVYDNLSQTPYIPGQGIEAGDKNRYLVRYWHRITVRSIAQHLDWYQKTPTSFISLYGDSSSALDAARTRVEKRNIKLDGKWHNRGPVFIAVISARQLADAGVFCFSTEDLKSERMLNLQGMSINHPLACKLNEREWFAMDRIPEVAVECVLGEDVVARGGMGYSM